MADGCEIPRSVLQAIVTHARIAAPAECCGVLLGHSCTVVDALPSRNLADRDTRYLLDPRTHFRARRMARARGIEVIGFYHSHPHSAPKPSETDVAEASCPGAVCLIAGVVDGSPVAAAFVWGGAAFDELPLTVVP